MKEDFKRVLELTGLLCDELIDDEQFVELDKLLAEDVNARRVYTSFLEVHHGLAPGGSLGQGQNEKSEERLVKDMPKARSWVRFCTTAAAALIVVGLVFFSLESSQAPPIAVLTRVIDVKWSHPTRFRGEIGEALERGWLKIDAGVVELVFSSGASVSLEGPAQLRIDSPLKCFSDSGMLVANCPESAYGFTIEFRGGEVVDLGTEFALNTRVEGETNVHVLNGKVNVALLDDTREVIERQELTENTAVVLNSSEGEIAPMAYNQSMFDELRRDSLIKSQPVKLQFDIGRRAGLYHGTDAPGHSGGDLFAHENVWNQIIGDQAGSFVMADGNLCPFPIKVDYGQGDGEINWQAAPVDRLGKVYKRARGVANSALSLDNLFCHDELGMRVSGLPKGRYRVYVLCRSFRRQKATYNVSIGANLRKAWSEPMKVLPMKDEGVPEWEQGYTYAMGEVEIKNSKDWLTIITESIDDYTLKNIDRMKKAPRNNRSTLLGLQIVELD